MPKLISHPADGCSYELQRLRRHGWLQRRHQLLLALWLTCSGFTWPGRVPHLSYQASHGSVAERVEALRVLEEYPGQATRDACLAGLEDGASEVRAQAARCVGAAGDERATTNLLDLADAKDPQERAAALEALGRMAVARALPSIERALADDRPALRVEAVRALSAYVLNGSFGISKLGPLLSAPQVEVRLAAVELLSTNVAQAAMATRTVQLRAAAKDQLPEVRAAALRVMGSTRDARHLPDLSTALTDTDEAVRLAAIAALGDSNLPGATAPLRPLVAASSPLRAARTALAALGRIDDPSVLPPLAAALTRPELTEGAASALVARAQRVNQKEAYQQTITALQRAIDATQSWQRTTATTDRALPTLDGDQSGATSTIVLATTTRPKNAAALSFASTITMKSAEARLARDHTSATKLKGEAYPSAAPDVASTNTTAVAKPRLARDHISATLLGGEAYSSAAPDFASTNTTTLAKARLARDHNSTTKLKGEAGAADAPERSAPALGFASTNSAESAKALLSSDHTSAAALTGAAVALELAKSSTELAKPVLARDNLLTASTSVLLASTTTFAEPVSSTGGAAAASVADAALDALARASLELAPFCDVRGAAAGLLRALEAGRGEAVSLTRHLLALAPAGAAGADHQQLLAALLARDPASSPRLAEAVLAVLVASPDATQLVAAKREPLLHLAVTQPSTTRLHALLRVADADSSLDARRALAALWAEQPALAAQREQIDRLVGWLDDADVEVREHSSIALGNAADTAAVEMLSARLQRDAPHPELTLRACAGAVLRGQLPSGLRERLLQQFQSYLSKPDETVAMSAIFALRAARDQRTAPWIAGLLRGNSLQLRAAAIQALGGFDQPEARRMLRDMLRGDNLHNATNAALALAELGSDRDVEALLRAAERGSWPLPPAAAYAAARITARGVTRKHSLERVLCGFAQLRDSYVLSNIVSALATLGADACDEQIQPKKLLDPTLPSSVRAAAALWLQSTRPHSPEETTERSGLLARCVSDHDSAVAAACKPNTAQPAPAGQAVLRAIEPDTNNPLTNRVIALRHPDGTVFVGQTDNTGRVLVPRAAPRELSLEAPAALGPLALPARSTNAPK